MDRLFGKPKEKAPRPTLQGASETMEKRGERQDDRIMKLDKEVKNMQVDASKCVAKCTELFIESLVEGSFHSMKANKRKTIKYNDVEHHVLR